MIKGINRQIIEVVHPDHPYFERALLFIKTPYADQPPDLLRMEAERYVKETGSFSALRDRRTMRWFRGTVLVLMGGFLGMYGGILLSSL